MAEGGVQVQEAALQQVLDSGEPLEVEYAGQTLADGDESWFHLSVSSDRDATGAVVGVLASTRDITEIKRAQQALTRQALHDPLTDLANRYLLMDRLGGALDRLGRRPGRLTLFFIDLDHFKAINDCYGHEIGDRVLVEVARRLERVARRVDTVARLGGDEYVVLCDHVMDVGVSMVAQRIVDALAVPFDDGMVAFPLSASVGASVTDNALVGASGMLHSADSAMYRAKLSGRNRFEIHQARPSGPPA
jgi:diguanylate cyclase (GGDEF)-like protein